MPQIYSLFNFFCSAQIATTPMHTSSVITLLTHLGVGATEEMNRFPRTTRSKAITVPVKGLLRVSESAKEPQCKVPISESHNVPNQSATPDWRQNSPH